MKIDDGFIAFLFYGIQIVGAVGLYIYYTRKNKQAEEAYWERVDEEKTI